MFNVVVESETLPRYSYQQQQPQEQPLYSK